MRSSNIALPAALGGASWPLMTWLNDVLADNQHGLITSIAIGIALLLRNPNIKTKVNEFTDKGF